MESILGWLTYILTLAIIAVAIISVWVDTDKEIKEDAKFKNTVVAKKMADKMFEEYVRTAEYHVYQKPAKFINESDINWGDTKEVLM